LLDTLTASPVAIGPSVTETEPSYSGGALSRPSAGMVALFDAATGQHVGSLTDAQFVDVSRRLERESTTDNDYYLSTATLDMLAEANVDPATLALLRHALGGRDGMDIRWVRPEAQSGERLAE
jgi:processive 1,2-diacylglycerol beta-glucosyltransferase